MAYSIQMTPAISEAISQWSDYLTLCARRSPRGEVLDRDGLHIAWADVPVPVYNAILINEAVEEAEDMRERLRAAAEFGRGRPQMMALFLCRDALAAEVDAKLEELLGAAGFVPSIPMTVMAVEGELAGGRATAAELRVVADRDAAVELMRLNCVAYHMPVEWAAMTVDAGMAPVEGEDFAVVAYAGGAPVATATSTLIDGRVYVSLVATDPEHRRRGYADAAMRRSIELARKASGFSRVVLHASEDGRPVYEKMGFVKTARYLGCFTATEDTTPA